MTYVLILIFTVGYKGGIASVPFYATEASCETAGKQFVSELRDAVYPSFVCLPIDKATP